MEYPTLEEALEEIGITARVEKRARKDERVQFAKKLIQKGWDSAEIAETTGLDLPTVESLMGIVHA